MVDCGLRGSTEALRVVDRALRHGCNGLILILITIVFVIIVEHFEMFIPRALKRREKIERRSLPRMKITAMPDYLEVLSGISSSMAFDLQETTPISPLRRINTVRLSLTHRYCVTA